MVIGSLGPRGWALVGGGGGGGSEWLLLLVVATAYSEGWRGLKLEATTALGMTLTMRGSNEARRTVFSLLVNVSGRPSVGSARRVPSMTDADDMVDVAEYEFEQLVCQDTGCICKAEQTVIRKDGAQTHCPSMEDGLVA